MEDSKHKSYKKQESVKKNEELMRGHRYTERRLRERERDSDKENDRESERSVKDHNGGGIDGVKDRDRKRRKREYGYKESSSIALKKIDADMEEEQRKLNDDMEKRRRRVQEWLEKKGKQLGVTDCKTRSLDGETDDEEYAHVDGDMNLDDNKQETNQNALQNGGDMEEDEIDPLDAFMNSMVIPEVNKLISSDVCVSDQKSFDDKNKDNKRSTGRIIPGDYDEDPLEDEDDDEIMKQVKKTKVEKLSLVDHSKIKYIEFRKNFYIEVKEIKKMTQEEVAAYRKEVELKVHGKQVPKPIKTWYQTGLATKILEIIRKLNYEKPMPIQAQALSAIMSGRDCIGVAKTGSGKTLAYVLPMLRHVMDQPELSSGDGPIGLIMAPTRELVQQIHSDIRKFTKVLGLRCVPVYGGSSVAQQISNLKRGAEIVVCTPGRMIDVLCTSGGKITNLRRVSYLVMDEADRMFDMGFEPQITRIVQNTQPNRQTVLFSATFPRQVEVLARKVLNKPVEIQVGFRSVVNKDITHVVEVRPENERFLRLLELLGEWYERGKILVFVQSQDKCDSLFRDLLKHWYPCLSLHGGKDQTDRESTVSDFKSNACNLLIATSIAARGLDVKELELVVNYDAPNHYEDYVHRVGRTGRAGRKGFAVTFLSSEDERYAPDLVKALELSNQVVSDDLKTLADGFMGKVKQGLVQAHGTGYGGSGFKFNEEEEEVRKAAKKAQCKEYGFEEDKSDSDDDDDDEAGDDIRLQAAASQQPNTSGVPVPLQSNEGAALLPPMNVLHILARIQAGSQPEHYEAELEINDIPQNARWKVTHKETLGAISDWTGAAITTRGQYIPPGKIPGPRERKLYLFIEGGSELCVKRAKAELKRFLEDFTTQVLPLPQSRYSV